ncbi:leucyl aminopeptidase [Azospirillum sp. RWY-5-1]|uniref:Probable cytosol aminopeptidase n=1 Tax=Azospirillum oleiclasticum TaxID=2735135 RepID=A0ABX2TMH3_9PROT|nr:leucyl aminopeptidase [Azospirillum oleiclasticum]NYZ17013.1 leucyl aminopeptidase [Azospirillum oleiclasticum]NYZ24543.1 leucyl aminopeptidase [Azospirillum oleiclasticum]
MKFSFAKPVLPKDGTVVVTVLADRRLGAAGQDLDGTTGGALTRAMKASRFTGKREETLAILAPAGVGLDRILLIGLGKPEDLDESALQAAGGTVVGALASSGETEAAVLVEVPPEADLSPAFVAAQMAFGARLRSYRFDRYRTTEKKDAKPSLKTVRFLTDDADGAKKAFGPLAAVADGVFFTRDVVSEPANIVHPESLAERCKDLAELGVEVDVLDLKKLKKLGMGALIGVAQGSVYEPRVVVMRWNGNPDAEDKAPVALVGKGVTFDTGGISIKPAGGMEDMKWDMSGAGVVIGTMHALAARKAKANVVGIVGLVENMPSGTAQRPGDVVTSLSGQTIEVINTDAEGRLVLADCLWYAQEEFKPKLMVDLATLTGAVIVALGTEYAGLFANDDELADSLAAAGRKVGEPLWRLPLGDAYDKEINSDIADMKNVSAGRNGGSIIGAVFLQRFVNKVPWAHLDIAGVAWSKKDTATVPKGGTAFGVRLLDRFIADRHEA